MCTIDTARVRTSRTTKITACAIALLVATIGGTQRATGDEVSDKPEKLVSKYLGWSFGNETKDQDYHVSSLRILGYQERYSFLIAKKGSAFRYAVYNEKKQPLRTVVYDGERFQIVGQDGINVAHEVDLELTLLAEVYLMSNDLTFIRTAELTSEPNNLLKYHCRSFGDRLTVDLTLSPDGLLRGAEIITSSGRESYTPVAVSPIAAAKKFYSRWRRNNEPLIILESLQPGALVYDGELKVVEWLKNERP